MTLICGAGIYGAGMSPGLLRRVRPALFSGLCAVALLGCARVEAPEVASAAPATAAAPTDPVVAFAAAAQPGMESVVTMPGSGGTARVRLLRAYYAASGRDCREVLVGAGLDERSRLVCQADGQWAEARPLLRSGGVRRP